MQQRSGVDLSVDLRSENWKLRQKLKMMQQQLELVEGEKRDLTYALEE